MSLPPRRLDHAGIAARVPHSGRMCLLDSLEHWDEAAIDCRAGDHRAADHPLRSRSGLLASAAIELAGQAMALHGALLGAARAAGTPSGADRGEAGDTADAAGSGPRPGFLASVRQLRFGCWCLDDHPGPLRVQAERLAGDAGQVQYRFRVSDAGQRVLAEGRAAVFLGRIG